MTDDKIHAGQTAFPDASPLCGATMCPFPESRGAALTCSDWSQGGGAADPERRQEAYGTAAKSFPLSYDVWVPVVLLLKKL